MAYFTELPNILYQFPDNIVRQYNNLSFRPAVIERVIQDASNFDLYIIEDGDTPETIAFDYYGDATLHWVLMLTNNITNYYTQWPKSRLAFEKYLYGKYRQVLDSDQQLVTLTNEQIDEYVAFVGSEANNWTGRIEGTNVVTHPSYFEADEQRYNWEFINVNNNVPRNAYGQVIQKPINPTPISIFVDEDRVNTAFRNIILLKQQVISEIQYELRALANGQ